MTPEAQLIAIAQACGWKQPFGPTGARTCRLHNYPGDLNAMHEAEKVLTDEQRWQQACFIVDYHQATAEFPLFSRSEVIALASATAAQRAEAFLRTLNLYTNE